MMPRKKENGSRNGSPEKPLTVHIGFPRGSPSQYGSEVGKWGHPPGAANTVNNQAPSKTEQDQRFHQLQDMFTGKVDADVIYVILSECDWKVEDAVEKLLELSLPATQNPLPSLKTVASTLSTPSTMASDRPQQLHHDMGLANLRSRLPSVHNTELVNSGLPMLSPRTPNVTGLDFSPFPDLQHTDRSDDSIHVALEALDSYANPDLSAYIGAFQSQTSYDSNLFDVAQVDTINSNSNSFDPYSMSSTNQDTGGFSQCPQDGSMENFASVSQFGGSTNSSGHDQASFANMGGLEIYSQTFQPIQSVCPPVLPSTTYTTSANSFQEPVSPRTAFNSVMLGEGSVLPEHANRRPVREDSKDSAASDVSRVSDLGHGSEESTVDLSPGLVPKRHHRQVLRRQNISLDPQERASLEQLIEEVLIGGVDDGVMDPDDSSDEDDEESGDGCRIKRLSRSEDGTKVTPSQLKVAAKHMKNLPPRFLKRLQATTLGGRVSGDELEGEGDDLELDELHVEEVMKVKKPKKKTKGLLDSLNQYVEDDVPITDPESEDGEGTADMVVSPEATAAPVCVEAFQPAPPRYSGNMSQQCLDVGASMQQQQQQQKQQQFQAPAVSPTPQMKPAHTHIILRPNVVNYNALDPERILQTQPHMSRPQQHVIRPHNSSRDHTPESRPRPHDPNQQRFSLDAPEFVPRSFHPINPPATQVVSSPVSQLREGFTGPGVYSYSPRPGSPYTVHAGSPYPAGGRAGSPYHLGLGSSLSPQMARRTLTGSPIAMVQMAPAGRHSPIPPAFFIPKAPSTAAVAAAAMHGHPAVLPYAGYPVAHFPVHPNLRYAVPPGYRPPFMPPGTTPHRIVPQTFKYSPKDRLQQNNSRPNSAPTVNAPGSSVSPSVSANQQSQAATVSDKRQTTPFQKVFGKSQQESKLHPESKLDKDGKEAKNFSTQHSRSSRSSTEDDISPQETIALILEKGTRLMVILRGVPGSGKTHLAKELVNDGVILSTDDYFVTKDGYEFDYSKVGEAHEWNQKRAKQALQDGCNPVLIDNTNTQAWEMKAYVLLAVKYDYVIEIVEPDTPWKFRAKELAKRNKHNVAKELIQRMIDRYEHNVTVASIISTSDKIRTEVEKKQRQAALRAEHSAGSQLTEGPLPSEERKAKKKTRRGKGRKKKARLRELREAEANKEREKTGDEASSDEESIPEGEQSIHKTSTEALVVVTQISDSAKEKCVEVKNEGMEIPIKATSPLSQNVVEKEEQSTPEKKLSPDAAPVVDQYIAQISQQDATSQDAVKLSDESDSSHDSVSSPSTAESQLSQDSEEVGEPLCTGDLGGRVAQEEVKNVRRDAKHVMRSLQRNLFAMLQTKRGTARTGLQNLISKYQSSPDVRAEIEEIINEKMFDGMVNKEVEEITSCAPVHDEQLPTDSQRLTETDVCSIMHVLGQIAVDTDSSSDSNNDSNNNQSGAAEKAVEGTDSEADMVNVCEETEARNTGGVGVSHIVEQAYWQTAQAAHDPYLVGGVTSASAPPHVKSQASWSDSSSSEVPFEARPKARRERRRPYKKPKVVSDTFWNVSSDKQDENADSANSSLASSEPGTPKALIASGNSSGLRSRRLSGSNRLPAEFPMPEMDASENRPLPIKDWQLPDFTTQQVLFSPPVHKPAIPKVDVGTYTHPRDFATIQRLVQCPADTSQQLPSTDIDGGFVGIRNTCARVIYTDTYVSSAVTVAQRLMIHRSCSTRELEEESRPNGLIFLKSCFAAVAEDDLAEFLERCEGDVTWAANILLDAGYEYNENPQCTLPSGVTKGALPLVERQTVRTVDLGITEAAPATSSPEWPCITQVCSPPTLMQLCHSYLPTEETLTEEVHEQYVETSVQRLNTISQFQRQHSRSSVAETVSAVQLKHTQASGSSLDIAPPSPEVDIFHGLLETTAALSPTLDSLSPNEIIIPGMAGAEDRDEMTLTLSPALAEQLIASFGPVGFHISGDSLAPEDLVVKLTRKTAKQLHRRWALTLQDTFISQESAIQQMIQQDEALAKQMQAEEEQLMDILQQNVASSKLKADSQPESLKEIMEEQMAIAVSKNKSSQMDVEVSQSHANSLATKMKRQRIQQMFPTVDQLSLEDVYKSTGYNMTSTVAAVQASVGDNEPVHNVWTPEAIRAYEDMLLRQAVKESLQQQWLGTEEEEADPVLALSNPQYQDLRAEASTHYRLRHECFQKAQEAFRHNRRSVACFYSQQGHLHTQKLKEANRRASLKIVELRNADMSETNTIDLHGLHVNEALTILSEVIARREQELRQRIDKRRDYLFVVTGTGSHSRGGKAKIRPAVINYLTRRHYGFNEDIPGSIKVQMRYKDDL